MGPRAAGIKLLLVVLVVLVVLLLLWVRCGVRELACLCLGLGLGLVDPGGGSQSINLSTISREVCKGRGGRVEVNNRWRLELI
jgi:hypothetical protein